MDKKIVVVVPCFNEAHRFPIGYWQDLISSVTSTHWIFVNDGSKDATGLILEELIAGSTAEVIHSKKNLGKGNSVREGFIYALGQSSQYKTLGYMDSDGAFSKKDLLRLINKVDEFEISQHKIDAILSSRVALAGHHINRNPSRHYIGRVIATYLTRNWVDAPYDTQSGLKLFSNSNSFQKAINEVFQTSWFVDIEIMTRIGIENGGGLNLWEEPLTSWSDIAGSKLNFKHAPNLIREMFVARREVSRLIEMRGF
jgi:dolichyl-phosphate beta-glucosyltransferase